MLLLKLHMRLRRCRVVAGGSFKSQHTVERQMTNVRAMNRLGMNMLTFAIGSIPILIVCIVAMVNLRSLSTLGEGEKSPCKTYRNAHLFIEVEILASTAAIVWLIAMIIDPIINTVADRKITAMLRTWLRYFSGHVKSVQRQITESTRISKESSDMQQSSVQPTRF
ncbi:hypothetical protein GCK32_017555 [Trichostrongylus colubriformis]|uniref:G-protein coupled receptors family 1 profile domain-containing protein n=1 Tax=Trichostrongylus colubriformis TaxID=6319 RepID=A0AAN8FL73_TRICO